MVLPRRKHIPDPTISPLSRTWERGDSAQGAGWVRVEGYSAAAREHGKFPGMAGVYNETIMPRYIEMGARFILSGQDAAFMAAGAAQRTGFLRKLPVA